MRWEGRGMDGDGDGGGGGGGGGGGDGGGGGGGGGDGGGGGGGGGDGGEWYLLCRVTRMENLPLFVCDVAELVLEVLRHRHPARVGGPERPNEVPDLSCLGTPSAQEAVS